MLWVLVRATYLRRRILLPEDDGATTMDEDSLRSSIDDPTTTITAHHWILNALGSLICVAMFALISGLFLGLLTLDTVDLQIIQRASLDEEERMYATALIPLVKRRHQILVTLELMNALAYETLPIFLDALVPSWAAVLLSVTIVMIFGEIIPSGIFMGPNQLYLGYHMVPLMQFFLWLFTPLATPLVKLLDYLTDTDEDDTDPYSRSELSALVRIQHEAELHPSREPRLSRVMKQDRRKDQSWRALKEELLERVQEKQESHPQLFAEDEEDADDLFAERLSLQLHPREVAMVEGALRMKTVHAMDVYTPLSSVYCVADSAVLDRMTITTIYGHGFSRVPVYRANPDDPDDTSQILGFLITRQLMLIDWDHAREIATLPLQRPTCVSPRMNLIDLFEVLQKDGRMMTFVCARPDLANKALKVELPIPVEAGLVGIITLVDIMESIVQDRIYDEGDMRDRDRAVATLHRWAATMVTQFLRRSVKKLERRRSSQLGAVGVNGSFDGAMGNNNHHHPAASSSTESPSNNGSSSTSQDRHVRFHANTAREEESAPLLPTIAPPAVRIHKPKLRNRLFMSGQ